MRRYLETHPWLTFDFDMERIPARTWIALGEARSKCEHIAGVPLPPPAAARLHQVYLAKGVHATTAIEGNTLTEEQVALRLEGALPLPESKEYLGQEVDNIIGACNALLTRVADPADALEILTVDTIKDYNRRVLAGLDLGDDVRPGEIPTFNVVVANYRGAPREDCELLLGRFCEWLNHESFRPKGPDALIYGIIRAILAHLYLVWIHPFADGNGRTSRLLEYQILLSAGAPSPVAHLLSNHYNETRAEYYRQLDRSSKGTGNPGAFLSYAVQGLVDGLRAQLDHIRGVQLTIAWRDYVHELFRGKDSAGDIRRRRLVLDLTEQSKPVPRHALPFITPRIAEAYRERGDKTLSRDIHALVEMGLIDLVPGGYVTRDDMMHAFRPLRRSL